MVGNCVKHAGFFPLLLVLLLVGCESLGVKPGGTRTVFDEFAQSFDPNNGISFRTRQTLRQLDLETTFNDNPRQAFERLTALITDYTSQDILFACGEVAYRIANFAESKNNPESCKFYYLSAGYAYHYLFDFCHEKPATAQDNEARLLPQHLFDPRFRLACELYNLALSKCIRNAQKQNLLDSSNSMTVRGFQNGEAFVSVKHHGFHCKDEDFGPLLFCADYDVTGFQNLYRNYGLGVPLIGSYKTNQQPDKEVQFARKFQTMHFPVTAFFRFEGKAKDLLTTRCSQLELYNPWHHTTVKVNQTLVPLETDLTTPLAYFLSKTDFNSLAIKGFLWAKDVQRQEGIYLLEPYQPGKIPVLMVHGLLSSPLSWAPMLNDLLSDPQIRHRYQFWFYVYPTGNPYIQTASKLRDAVAGLRKQLDPEKQNPQLDRMVVVGHSMGGLISRLLTLQGGDDFYASTFDRPLEILNLNNDVRTNLKKIYYFDRVPEVERVIFLGTPHKGSQLSPSFLGQLGKKLIFIPDNMRLFTQQIIESNPGASLEEKEKLTSIDQLSPSAPLFQVLSKRNKPNGTCYHNIFAVIPEGKLHQLEEWLGWTDGPGDGVVPVSSSKLDGADSELQVQADHSKVLRHPLAVQEVKRVLYQHLNTTK